MDPPIRRLRSRGTLGQQSASGLPPFPFPSFLWDVGKALHLAMSIPALLPAFSAVDFIHRLASPFQVLPQFGETTIIMMPDISVRLVQAHRNLLERVPLEEAQLQRVPLLNRQVFESPLECTLTEVRF